MATNVVNVDPYLRTSWHFTDDRQLLTELTRSFNEVAIVTNMREIATYALNLPAITGKQFFLGGSNRQQQSLRQVILFNATGNYPHHINTTGIGLFVSGYGSFTDGTNSYGVIYGSSVATAGQVSFYITPTNVVVLAGAGAPTITSGIIIIEWLSQP